MKKTCLFLFLIFSIQCYAQSSTKIITYNIRYSKGQDGIDKWDNRKAKVIDIIKSNNPDLVGFQEVLKKQLDYIKRNLDGYDYVGVGRDDGKTKGEYSPIFYKKDKYTLVNKGWFWLAEDCTKPGKGWDANCNRICTWVVLRDSITKYSFLMLNTHLDHKGKEARTNSITALKDSITSLCMKNVKSMFCSTIVTGDFNFTPTDNNYKSFAVKRIKPDSLHNAAADSMAAHSVRLHVEDTPFFENFLKWRPREDSYTIATKREGTVGTTNSFKLQGPYNNRIDYVWLVGFKNTVKSYKTINDTLPNGHWPSDHFPVMVEVTQ